MVACNQQIAFRVFWKQRIIVSNALLQSCFFNPVADEHFTYRLFFFPTSKVGSCYSMGKDLKGNSNYIGQALNKVF